MSSEGQRPPIVLTNDLDGVHFTAPFPIMTALALLRGRLRLPNEGASQGEYRPARSLVRRTRDALWRLTIRARPYRRESLAALAEFRRVLQRHGRQARMAVLSGRLQDQHGITRARLERSGHLAYFQDLYLNPGHHTASWKERVTRELVAAGNSVVHLEDDLRAALCVARVNGDRNPPPVLVYLIRNPSNAAGLLRRAQIALPANVVPVRSLHEAARDLDGRLERGDF